MVCGITPGGRPREQDISLSRSGLRSRSVFCSACAAALPEDPPTTCRQCGHAHWANPKPSASALVGHDDGLVLARRAKDPWAGHWDVPGGFCDPGEHPAATAVREVREEAGLRVEVVGFLGAWVDAYQEPGRRQESTLNLFYVAKLIGPFAPVPAVGEILEVAVFQPNDPPNALAFPAQLDPVLTAWRRAVTEATSWTPSFDLAQA